MKIRPYQPTDYTLVKLMLADRGLQSKDMHFLRLHTFVLEDNEQILGVISLNFEDNYPLLVHFCTSLNLTNSQRIKVTWKLARAVNKIFKENGYIIFQVTVPCNNERMDRLVKRYWPKHEWITKVSGSMEIETNVYLVEGK